MFYFLNGVVDLWVLTILFFTRSYVFLIMQRDIKKTHKQMFVAHRGGNVKRHWMGGKKTRNKDMVGRKYQTVRV